MRKVVFAVLVSGIALSARSQPAWPADPWPGIVETASEALSASADQAHPKQRQKREQKQKETPKDEIQVHPLRGIPYVVTRHLQNDDLEHPGYVEMLPFGFLNDLFSLNANQHWMDVGAGAAIAMIEYLNSGGAANSTAVTIDRYDVTITGHKDNLLDESLPKYAGRFRYVYDPHGVKGIEDYSVRDLGQADIISDVFGAIAYSCQLDTVFAKFGELLKKEGRAYMLVPAGFLDEEATKPVLSIVGPHNEAISLDEWLRAFRGLVVVPTKDGMNESVRILGYQKYHGSFSIKLVMLKKISDQVVIPHLEPLYPEKEKYCIDIPNGPPVRKYRWNRTK